MISRRRALAAAGSALALGAAGFWRFGRRGRAADEDPVDALGRVFEEAERSAALNAAVDTIRRGGPREQVLAALVLAGVRQIRPRPYLGPQFHAVMMMPFIESAARRRTTIDQWRPVLWAVDLFKESQEIYRSEGGVPLGPPPRVARVANPAALLADALEAWDEPAADEAITSLHEQGSKDQAFAALFRYGARDYRDIGHKSIYVAGAWRLLQTMEWRRALPILRSVALALLRHDGPTPPRHPRFDATWARNRELAAHLWPHEGAPAERPGATGELLSVFRFASDTDACQATLDLLREGAGTQPVWDAIACGAAELVMNRPKSLIALHAVTTANALAFAWRTAAEAETRRLILLHAVGRLTAFRDYALEKEGPPAGADAIDEFEPAPGKVEASAIFDAPDREATRLALGHLERGGDPGRVFSLMRDVVLAKASDSHDYKFSEAVVEHFDWISPAWRRRFLAASLAHVRRWTAPASPRVEQVDSLLKRAG